MAQTIRSAKQKLASGVYSNPIPFGAEAVNVDLANGYNLEDTLGNIDVANKGAVQAQLDKHTQDIATNKANIESNDVDIINLQSRASVNEANIASNKAAIEVNEDNIQKNAENIAMNTANIISNDEDILSLQGRVTQNETDIAENLAAIESNDADILSLQNRVSTNETNIAKNTTDISNLDTRVTQEVETINKNIESIEGAFNGDLSGLTLRVSANETNIATNTENIAKNAENIASNDIDIEALKAKDIELQTAIESNDTDIVNINTTLEQHTKDIADRVTKAEAAPFIKGIEYNGSTYTFTFTKYDGSTQTVELPFENLIDRGYFDTDTEEIVLVLSTGEEVRIPAASLVDDYTGKENEQINTTVANNVVEAILKTGSVNETFLTTELQTRLTNMEDKYTKSEVDALLAARSEFVQVETW